MMRILLVVCVLSLPACSATGTAERTECAGLADRWANLQQEYIDRLDDGPAADRWLASALLEQARDAEAVGCESDVSAGGPALCSRIDELVATSDAAREVIEQLRAGCDM